MVDRPPQVLVLHHSPKTPAGASTIHVCPALDRKPLGGGPSTTAAAGPTHRQYAGPSRDGSHLLRWHVRGSSQATPSLIPATTGPSGFSAGHGPASMAPCFHSGVPAVTGAPSWVLRADRVDSAGEHRAVGAYPSGRCTTTAYGLVFNVRGFQVTPIGRSLLRGCPTVL